MKTIYYQLRNNNHDCRIPRFRFGNLKRLQYCNFPIIWNDLDCHIIKI